MNESMTDGNEPDQARLWDLWAKNYDEFHAHNDPDPVVRFLGAVAPEGRFLEFGVGTGRIALPLAGSGRGVDGIDISPEMSRALIQKRGDSDLEVIVGDMAEYRHSPVYACTYIVYGALYSITSQEKQVECMARAAESLAPGGYLVVEGYVPHPGILRPSRNLSLRNVREDGLSVSASDADASTQRISFLELDFAASGVKTLPVEQRYVWPSELDLMARMAGLRLKSRVGDYDLRSFIRTSERHVSVYEKAA